MIRFAPDKINEILACVDLSNVANKHQLGTYKRQKTRNAQGLRWLEKIHTKIKQPCGKFHDQVLEIFKRRSGMTVAQA